MSFSRNPWYYNFAVKLFIFIAVVTVLIAGSAIFIPLMIAIFFTFLLLPVSRALERKKIPRFIAILISIFIALFLFSGVIYFFINQLNSFRDDLPEIQNQLLAKGGQILIWTEEITDISPDRQIDWLRNKATEFAKDGPTVIMGIFSTTGNFLALFALIPFYIFFLTYFREKYRRFIILVDKHNHRRTLDIIKKISFVSRNYLKGDFLDVLILSILGSVGYLLLGIKHAILFGVMAAILNIIPYIGVLIGSLLPILMALITKDEIGYAVGAAGVAIAVQFIDNNFISPYVVGSSVSINPLTAIIVLLAGGLLWGVAGMILSIPLAGMMKVAFDNIETLKPYGYLIGEEVNFKGKGFFNSKV